MDDDEMQQFSLRWHNHQNSVIGALGRMLSSGALTDVTLIASGTSVKAHRLVLASCSQYFAQIFKELDTDSNAVVVVLGCEPAELRLLLTFMYTGEVTASKKILPALLRLAQTLKVSGLTDADTNPTTPHNSEPDLAQEEPISPANLEPKSDLNSNFLINDNSDTHSRLNCDDVSNPDITSPSQDLAKSDKDRLSKLDQIVQNLYSTHKIGNPIAQYVNPLGVHLSEPEPYERKYRTNQSICSICNKRLSNQYNLRVHMETHAGRRHACRACSHVSRSRDALRKHVAYRHHQSQSEPISAHNLS